MVFVTISIVCIAADNSKTVQYSRFVTFNTVDNVVAIFTIVDEIRAIIAYEVAAEEGLV